MKATLPFKSFDEWVSYVFDRPVDEDEAWHWKEPHPFNSCTIDAPKAPSRICLEYCTRLFSRPRFLLNRFSLAQINQALWFIVNASCSSHMFAILDQNLPWLDRKRCIESVFSLNQRLFAVACDEACSHEDSPRNPLNSICYMFWGLIPHGVDWIFPENYTEIMEKLPPGDPGPEVPIEVVSNPV